MCVFSYILQNLKDDIARLRVQLSEANHKLCQLQTFRTSVARLLHLRDIPHSSLLQRLQTLCQAHQVMSFVYSFTSAFTLSIENRLKK